MPSHAMPKGLFMMRLALPFGKQPFVKCSMRMRLVVFGLAAHLVLVRKFAFPRLHCAFVFFLEHPEAAPGSVLLQP